MTPVLKAPSGPRPQRALDETGDGAIGRALWWGGQSASMGKMLAWGAVVWGAYSAIQLGVNGIVLDEVVMPAQIVAGAVSYPQGHPHQMYWARVFSLSHYMSAAMWAMAPSTEFISAFRNFLFLFSSTFVPFALTLILTRFPAWGHAAAVLTLSETSCRFIGTYFMMVFPHFYSNGHIGLHVALLIAVLLVAGLWRMGGLLLGLLPSLHAAMVFVVGPWSACYLVMAWLKEREKFKRRLAPGIVSGLVICAALAAIIYIRTSNFRFEPPYDTQADGAMIYQQFSATTDGHRQPIRIASFAYLVSPVAFLALSALLLWNRKQPNRSDCFWVLLLGGVVWMYVYGTRLLQVITGSLPTLLQISMPPRLSNLGAMFLLPLTMAVILQALRTLREGTRLLALAMVTGLVALQAVLITVNRMLAFNHLIFIAWGLLFALDLYAHRGDPKRRLMSILGTLAVGGTLIVVFFSEGSAVLVPFTASFLGCYATLKVGERLSNLRPLDWQRSHRWVQIALACVCTVTAAVALPGEHITNNWDTGAEKWFNVSQYDYMLQDWLKRNARPDEMILPPIWPRTVLQVKITQPVVFEIDTKLFMTYMPHLAPSIGMMIRDLYGVDYANPDQLKSHLDRDGMLRPIYPVWLDGWRQRSVEEWQQLGRKYQFRLVLSPTKTVLNLPPALPGPLWTLYVIPSEMHR